MTAAALPRRIPEVRHIRLTALALLLLGAGLGFLSIFVLREGRVSTTVVAPMAIAAVGALCALLPGRSLAARAAPGKWTRAYLTVCGIGASGGMAWLSTIQTIHPIPLTFALVGVTCGACLRLSLALVVAMLPPWRPAAIMGLCGASVGLGGVVANLIGAWVASPGTRVDPVLLSAAAVPALLAVASIRVGRVRLEGTLERWSARQAEPGVRPRSILISASILLQATACTVGASWLAPYFSQRAGFALVECATVMALFWLGLAFGWSMAERLPGLRENLFPLAGLLVLVVAGAACLLYVGVAGLAVAGAAILGLTAGALFALTLRLGNWPATLGRSPWLLRSLHASLVVALVGSWVVGALGSGVRVDAPIWIILGCVFGAVGALFILVVDYRITGDAVMI